MLYTSANSDTGIRSERAATFCGPMSTSGNMQSHWLHRSYLGIIPQDALVLGFCTFLSFELNYSRVSIITEVLTERPHLIPPGAGASKTEARDVRVDGRSPTSNAVRVRYRDAHALRIAS